jgi:hypothetical protein
MKQETALTILWVMLCITALIALAIVADCSRDVTRMQNEGAQCVARGGTWVNLTSLGDGYCVEKTK